MKKFLAVFTVLLGLTMSLFAQEEFEISVGMPFYSNLDMPYRVNCLAFDLHGTSFKGGNIGFTTEVEFLRPNSLTNTNTNETSKVTSNAGLMMRTGLGCAIKVFDSNNMSLIVAPVVDAFFVIGDYFVADIGAGLQTSFTYRLIDLIGITARCDVSYFLYSIDDQGNNGSIKLLHVSPQIGATLYF